MFIFESLLYKYDKIYVVWVLLVGFIFIFEILVCENDLRMINFY